MIAIVIALLVLFPGTLLVLTIVAEVKDANAQVNQIVNEFAPATVPTEKG